LNGCLSKLGPHIRSHSGFVDKYIGDAIMALFPGDPADAVRAAVAMQREVAQVNHAGVGGASAPLAIGVGVHVGRVMMGTIGEVERFEATVISDAVNLTARLETLTKQLGCTLLISAEVAGRLTESELCWTRPLGTFAVKGKSKAVDLVEVFSADPEDLRTAKANAREALTRALALYKQSQTGDAIAILRDLAAKTPADGPVHWWLDRALREDAGDIPPSGRDVIRLDDK
jgi:two-component system sensor histidine kinase ChiS